MKRSDFDIDIELCKKHQDKKSVKHHLRTAARCKRKGKKANQLFALQFATEEARKHEQRRQNKRSAEQIAQDREALFAAIGTDWTSSRSLPDHKRSDIDALVKSGRIEKEVREQYDFVRNTHNLFGGHNACKRRIAHYRKV